MISGIASPPSVTSLVSKTTQPAAVSSPNLVNGDSVSLGSSDAQPAKGPSPFDVVRSNAPFLGSVAGSGLGLGLQVAGASVTGTGLFVGAFLGAIGGRIIGNVIRNADDVKPAPLPSALRAIQRNAPSIGAMAGAGVGLALGLTGGGGLFVSTLCGTIGGVICGNVIKSS